MPCVDIFFSQLKKWTINSVFVQGIMQQYTHFFWLQHTLFNISGSRPPNYKGTASSLQGIACRSPDGSMPQSAWTARARSMLLAALIIYCCCICKVLCVPLTHHRKTRAGTEYCHDTHFLYKCYDCKKEYSKCLVFHNLKYRSDMYWLISEMSLQLVLNPPNTATVNKKCLDFLSR